MTNALDKKWLVLIPLFFLFILRVSDLFLPYYNIDELTKLLFARFIIEGRMHLMEWLGNPYLLTHYINAIAYLLTQNHALFALRLIHLIWCLGTSYALYAAGCEFTGNRQGGFWAAIFYVGISLSFMSKDYRAALSESFSLLPLSLAIFFFFRTIKKNRIIYSLLTGFFIGLASLCKAPAGILVIPAFLVLFLLKTKKRYHLPLLILGLLGALLTPFLFVDNRYEAFISFFNNLDNSVQYIEAYDNMPFMYHLLKFIVRIGLVLSGFPLATLFMVQTLRCFVYQRDINKNVSKKEEWLFLITGLLSMYFVVNLGQRVFYHYFVFTIPFVSLLAAYSFEKYWRQVTKENKKIVYGFIWVGLLVPTIGFSVESYTGFSVQRKDYTQIIDYVKNNTKQEDSIFIWGNIPQIYFYSGREPSSTFFWADHLAGISPGTASMEYLRNGKNKLKLNETVVKDLKPAEYQEREAHILNSGMNPSFSDKELVSDDELLNLVTNKHWRKVFQDFTEYQPALFLDTSPSGIKGFDEYPIEKYEILKRYIEKNYHYEATIDRIIVYRKN